MSIHVNCITRNIYHAEWIGSISEKDTHNALEMVQRMAATNGDEEIAIIINLKGVCHFPVDIGHYRTLAESAPNVHVVTLLSAGKLARFLCEIVSRLTSIEVRYANTIDEAVAKSRRTMQQIAV